MTPPGNVALKIFCANNAGFLMNGKAQKTSNDSQSPTTGVVGKTAGKEVGVGETVTIQMRNGDGTGSAPFSFTRDGP
jgi:hypothetical protein